MGGHRAGRCRLALAWAGPPLRPPRVPYTRHVFPLAGCHVELVLFEKVESMKTETRPVAFSFPNAGFTMAWWLHCTCTWCRRTHRRWFR
jgi:hypothetical protein